MYNYMCNQCLSPLKLLVWIPLMHDALYSLRYYVIKFVSELRQVSGFSPDTLVSFTSKTLLFFNGCHDIAEFLLKVALNTITLTLNPINICNFILYMNDHWMLLCKVYVYCVVWNCKMAESALDVINKGLNGKMIQIWSESLIMYPPSSNMFYGVWCSL